MPYTVGMEQNTSAPAKVEVVRVTVPFVDVFALVVKVAVASLIVSAGLALAGLAVFMLILASQL